jgi:hypothetical protein
MLAQVGFIQMKKGKPVKLEPKVVVMCDKTGYRKYSLPTHRCRRVPVELEAA